MELTWIAYNVIRRVAARYVSDSASARYRLIMPMSELEKMGYRVHLQQIDPQCDIETVVSRLRGDVIVLSKLVSPDLQLFENVAKLVLKVIRKAQLSGKKVIADINDDHFSDRHLGEYYRLLVRMVDLVVASTPKMAEIISVHTSVPVYLAGDPFEGPKGIPQFDPPSAKTSSLLGGALKTIAWQFRKGRPLRLLWFGHGSNLSAIIDLLPDLTRIVTRHNIELHLVTSSNASIERLCNEFNVENGPAFCLRLSPWSADITWQALRDCDLVIIPTRMNDARKLVKSPNRLFEALRAGRFVIANPIPSYEEFADFTWLGDSIGSGILWALNHPREVRRRIKTGQRYVEEKHSPDVIARQWGTAIRAALDAGAAVPSGLRLDQGAGDNISSCG